MLNIILCVTYYKNKLAIGYDHELLFKLKDDIKFFKKITENNIILMGRKTFESLDNKPLKDRINLVMTNNIDLINTSYSFDDNYEFKNNLYYIDLLLFEKIYNNCKLPIFIIGGSEIYNIFIKSANRLYITYVKGDKEINFINTPNIFIDIFSSEFKLIDYSEKYSDIYNNQSITYRILTYDKTNKYSEEYKYLDLLNKVLYYGNKREDRTGIGTLSIFGEQLRFNVMDSIPLLTTKNVPIKSIIEELLWFCRGDTDSKILERKGINIWNANTSREFLNMRKLNDYPEGILGPGYGWQMRFQGAKYHYKYADTSKINRKEIGGFDQLEYILNELKTNPYSRRILMCYWVPYDFTNIALEPCHYSVQFYVENIYEVKYLSCHFTMRASDLGCGWAWNIVSYTILLYILAKKCNMIPKDIIYTVGDAHIYNNHIEQIKEQITRECRPFPKLLLDDSIIEKDWSEIESSDFELIGYFPHPSIKLKMAI